MEGGDGRGEEGRGRGSGTRDPQAGRCPALAKDGPACHTVNMSYHRHVNQHSARLNRFGNVTTIASLQSMSTSIGFFNFKTFTHFRKIKKFPVVLLSKQLRKIIIKSLIILHVIN